MAELWNQLKIAYPEIHFFDWLFENYEKPSGENT